MSRIATTAIAAGYFVSVFDGEETTVRNSRELAQIMAAVQTTDADNLELHGAGGEYLGSIALVYGNDGYDVIADHHTSLAAFLAPIDAYAASFDR